MLKFVLPPTPNLKFALPLMPTPDGSQWNIGGVGPSGIGAGVGHVDFRLFVSISFAFGSQRKRSFQWNMGLNFFFQTLRIVSAHTHIYTYGLYMFLSEIVTKKNKAASTPLYFPF